MADHTDDEMSEETFNAAVAETLRSRGRELAASMSEEFDRGMASMSAATVAREEDRPLTAAAVERVADLRVEWLDEHEPEPEAYR